MNQKCNNNRFVSAFKRGTRYSRKKLSHIYQFYYFDKKDRGWETYLYAPHSRVTNDK